jgi:transaldolase
MKFIIDDANIQKIKSIYNYYPVDGVTTNPSFLTKSGRKPYEVLKEIRDFIGDKAELRAQVILRTTEGMIEEGRKMVEILGKNTYIKIPTVPEGLKAMRILSSQGYKITATAFTLLYRRI